MVPKHGDLQKLITRRVEATERDALRDPREYQVKKK
jgi:hypothetical protein